MTAHTLKSSGNDFGAVEFAKLCQDLEDLVRDGRLDQSATLVEQIDKEYGRVQNALLAVIGKPQTKFVYETTVDHEPSQTAEVKIAQETKPSLSRVEPKVTAAPINLDTMAQLIGRQPDLLQELLDAVFDVAPHLSEDIQQWIHDLNTWHLSRPKLLLPDRETDTE
jgi:HPt (histidine-containing phosphotransfer) domain-containing protein